MDHLTEHDAAADAVSPRPVGARLVAPVPVDLSHMHGRRRRDRATPAVGETPRRRRSLPGRAVLPHRSLSARPGGCFPVCRSRRVPTSREVITC